MPKEAVVYSNGSQECERIIALLTSLQGIECFLEYRLNEHFSQRAFEQEFGSEAEYPQISIGAKHIGSLKETLQYMDDTGMFL